ncbi:MAG: ankyrin repeat domain-containing protein [Candidatus Cardinium sp.]|nr:MAG: ankyrin repeat domain-containing protein [Candidatus Cardinium sp.]
MASCVHTRQELGWNPSKRIKTYIGAAAGSLIATGLGVGIYKYANTQSAICTTGNSTDLIAAATNSNATFIPQVNPCFTHSMQNMSTEKTSFIINATHTDPTTFVPDGQPYDNRLLQNGTFLNDEIIQDIKNSKFSISNLECWLAKGFSIHARDKQNKTLLFYPLLQPGNEEYVKFLIKKGVDVNAKDTMAELTALHAAAWAGNQDYIKILLKHGASINAQDDEGSTPLCYAMFKGHKGCAELLKKEGADLCIKGSRHRHIIDCAPNGRLDIFDMVWDDWRKCS